MLTPTAAKQVKRRLDGKDPLVAVRELVAECDRVLARVKESRKAHKALSPPPAPGTTTQARREDRNKRAAEIRAAVMERADGKCEWCHCEGFVLEWAHIFGGGDRRHREDVTNTAANCWDCHRGWEKANPQTFRDAKEWAIRNFFGEALKEIEHREALAAASPTNKRGAF